jgi:hypothetical protein
VNFVPAFWFILYVLVSQLVFHLFYFIFSWIIMDFKFTCLLMAVGPSAWSSARQAAPFTEVNSAWHRLGPGLISAHPYGWEHVKHWVSIGLVLIASCFLSFMNSIWLFGVAANYYSGKLLIAWFRTFPSFVKNSIHLLFVTYISHLYLVGLTECDITHG